MMCYPSPDWWTTGTSRKCTTNCNGSMIWWTCQRRSCVHLSDIRSPDKTHGTQSGKSTINRDVPHSPNPLSDGPSRKSATRQDAQESDELHMPQWYRTPDGTLKRYSTKNTVDHDDNVQRTLDLSPGQICHVPSTCDSITWCL